MSISRRVGEMHHRQSLPRRYGAFHAPCILLLLLVATTGCAALGINSPGCFNSERKKRDAEVARRLTNQRDYAEFEAALACWNQQDVRGCREHLEPLLERNADHRDARLLMADVLVAEKQPKKALELVRHVLKAHPDDADAQYAMALLLDSTRHSAEALPYYDRATQLAPENEVYAAGYRTAWEAAEGREAGGNRPTKAAVAASVQQAAKRSDSSALGLLAEDKVVPPTTAAKKTGHSDSKDRDDKSPRAIGLERGYKALAEGSPQTALAHFRKEAELHPDNPQILISAASAALRYNQPAVAVELLRTAVASGETPQNRGRLANSAAAHRILGAAYYKLGEFHLSQTALQQALSLDKSNALSYFLMGCTLAKLGQVDAADVNFRQAQAFDPRYTVER
jgi:tetratricopeptide (TPR) repeat protein